MATVTYLNRAYEVGGLIHPFKLTKKQAQGLIWLYKAVTEDQQPWHLGLVNPLTLRTLEKLGLTHYDPAAGLCGMWNLTESGQVMGKFLTENLFQKTFR